MVVHHELWVLKPQLRVHSAVSYWGLDRVSIGSAELLGRVAIVCCGREVGVHQLAVVVEQRLHIVHVDLVLVADRVRPAAHGSSGTGAREVAPQRVVERRW